MANASHLDAAADTQRAVSLGDPGIESRRQREAIAHQLFGGASNAAPVQVGRFAVADRLGSGAMGDVYVAHDPRLDRRVAIKVLRKELGEAARTRMVLEGRALAQLDHPNVVPVYDVGLAGDRAFIAMALVRGSSLRQWMEAHPCIDARGVRQSVEVFCQAGQGLAHAHREGVVHRDFKPDNVLVGDDRSVRVADFGLAASVAHGPASVEESAGGGSDGEVTLSDDGTAVRMTADGEVVGTPAYMAPEQLLALAADPRSDQYAFCVSLFEALHGERPFAGATLGALRAEILLGKPPAPINRVVPGWLDAVLVRGLARDPDARFGSMDELIAALRDDPIARRRQRLTRTAAGIGALGLAAVAYVGGLRAETPDAPCPGPAEALVGLWDDDVQAAVEGALLSTSAVHRSRTAPAVGATLGVYAQRWAEMRHDSCLATRVRAEQSAAAFDAREGCFADRKRALIALVELVRREPDATVDRSAKAARQLPSLDACRASASFVSPAPIPDDAAEAAEVERVRQELARADAMRWAGDYPAALQAARAVAGEAGALGFGPLEVEAQELLATAELRSGVYDDAAARLERAFWMALSSKHDRLLASIAVHRVDVAVDLESPSNTDEWAQRARSSLERIGGDAHLEAALELALGILADRRSELDVAIAHKRRAIELERTSDEPDPVFEADMLGSLASSLMRKGDIAESIGRYRDVIERIDATVGPDHPSMASVRNNLAIALLTNGDAASAEIELDEALRVYRHVYPNGHLEFANTLAVTGMVHRDLGRLDSAGELLTEAVDMFRRVLGEDHVKVAQGLRSLGRVRLDQRRYDEVRQIVRDARAVLERQPALDRAQLGELEILQGDAELEAGAHPEALAAFGRALEHRSAQLGPDSPWLATDYRGLARAYSALGNYEAAIDNIEAAIAQRAGPYGDDDPKVGPLWQIRGEIEQTHGHHAAAVASYQRCLEILTAAGATNITGMVYANLGLARSRRALGQPHTGPLAQARRYAAQRPDDATLAAAVAELPR